MAPRMGLKRHCLTTAYTRSNESASRAEWGN